MDLKEGCVNWFWQTGLPSLEGDLGIFIKEKNNQYFLSLPFQNNVAATSIFICKWKNPNIENYFKK